MFSEDTALQTRKVVVIMFHNMQSHMTCTHMCVFIRQKIYESLVKIKYIIHGFQLCMNIPKTTQNQEMFHNLLSHLAC